MKTQKVLLAALIAGVLSLWGTQARADVVIDTFDTFDTGVGTWNTDWVVSDYPPGASLPDPVWWERVTQGQTDFGPADSVAGALNQGSYLGQFHAEVAVGGVGDFRLSYWAGPTPWADLTAGGANYLYLNIADSTPDTHFNLEVWDEVNRAPASASWTWAGGSGVMYLPFSDLVGGADLTQIQTMDVVASYVQSGQSFTLNEIGTTSVPEPGSMALCGLGLGLLSAGAVWRRIRKA